MSMYRQALVLLSLFALSGCLGNKRISDIGAAPSPTPAATSWSMPVGVYIAPSQRGKREINGLYASLKPDDPACCWISTHATISTMKAAPAKWLDLTVFVPNLAFFRAHTQSLDVALDRLPFEQRCCLSPGVHTLRFVLPDELQSRIGQMHIMIKTRYTFVPAREHLSIDKRRLGIILLRVDYGT